MPLVSIGRTSTRDERDSSSVTRHSIALAAGASDGRIALCRFSVLKAVHNRRTTSPAPVGWNNISRRPPSRRRAYFWPSLPWLVPKGKWFAGRGKWFAGRQSAFTTGKRATTVEPLIQPLARIARPAKGGSTAAYCQRPNGERATPLANHTTAANNLHVCKA